MIEELVSRVFAMRDCAHIQHWATLSYAKHKTLGEFYEALITKIDAIVEAYQGLYGLIGKVDLKSFPEGDVTDFVQTEMLWLQRNRDKIAEECALLENLLDDLTQLYASTYYQLVHLT